MIEFLLELIVELAGETLLDVAIHAVGESSRTRRAIARLLFFASAGAVAGGVSLLVLPRHFIRSRQMQLVALAVTPIVAGALFANVGRVREKHNKRVSSLEEFWSAFAFALAAAIVRYLAAR